MMHGIDALTIYTGWHGQTEFVRDELAHCYRHLNTGNAIKIAVKQYLLNA